jgi:hypothetical protein
MWFYIYVVCEMNHLYQLHFYNFLIDRKVLSEIWDIYLLCYVGTYFDIFNHKVYELEMS